MPTLSHAASRSRSTSRIGGAVFGALVAHREAFLHGLQASLVIAGLLLATTAASLSLRRARHRVPARDP